MVGFKEIGINKDLCKAIDELGFITPTEIQEQSIPFLLSNNSDLISLAQTGTGKTAAFGLPVIQKTQLKNKFVQSIILCPTRELCIQICKDLEKYSKYISIVVPEGETEESTTHDTLGKDKISFEKVLNKSIELLN